MLFSSLEFLYLYLPMVLLLYYLFPRRWRNAFLFLASLIFYGWDHPAYVLLMALTIFVDYIAGRMVDVRRGTTAARRWLVGTIIFNLALLGFFKYTGFLLDNLRLIKGLEAIPQFHVELPIGISFYTFQALSYVIDVYRDDTPVQKNAVAFGTYVTLFPQLIAGPIVRYRDVAEQMEERTLSVNAFVSGTRTFFCGLCKKVLLANTAGALWTSMRNLPPEQQTVVGAWIGVICYTFQMYFDFSGYSDMAIGLGRMLGFRFPENFYYPYTARSITDYWRRWHITLSTWFREYVYIPLGGNRRGEGRTYLNLLIVWFLTGLWHGASWNFIVWGLFFFVILAMERLFLGRYLERAPHILTHIYTMGIVVVSFTIFAFDGSAAGLMLSDALRYFRIMFGGAAFCNGTVLYDILRNLPFFAILIVGVTPLPRRAFWLLYEKHRFMDAVGLLLCVAALLLCTAYLLDSAYNPFLYFRF